MGPKKKQNNAKHNNANKSSGPTKKISNYETNDSSRETPKHKNASKSSGPTKKISNYETNDSSREASKLKTNQQPLTKAEKSVTYSSGIHPEPSNVISSEVSKYSKRRIESNWKPYEINEQELEVKRPPSFESVLASGIGSQFLFNDEKEWEDSYFDDGLIDEFFALDLKDLAMSLACIPANKRLNIDDSYFEPEILINMEDDARKCQTIYNKQGELVLEKNVAHRATCKKSKENIKLGSTFPPINSYNNIIVQHKPVCTNVSTARDLPTESINQLELELDNLLNFGTSKPIANPINDDLPVVSLDDSI